MIADAAAEWAEKIAADDSHGYDQHNRWGPDYDCSSLVISAYKAAGVPLQCTYTGNMYQDMTAKGFADVTGQVNLYSGAGLKRGDVLLNVASHTAICCGSGMIVQASLNEYGTVTGGATGDQNGREIVKRGYYLYSGGWDAVLRYPEREESGKQNVYVTKPGDSLWYIASKFYGTQDIPGGIRKLMRINKLQSDQIGVGVELRLEEGQEEERCSITVPVLRRGSAGLAVRMLQSCLSEKGAECRVTGDFDAETESAVKKFQAAAGTEQDGIAGKMTWERLLNN